MFAHDEGKKTQVRALHDPGEHRDVDQGRGQGGRGARNIQKNRKLQLISRTFKLFLSLDRPTSSASSSSPLTATQGLGESTRSSPGSSTRSEENHLPNQIPILQKRNYSLFFCRTPSSTTSSSMRSSRSTSSRRTGSSSGETWLIDFF